MSIDLGGRRLVGQRTARDKLGKVLSSGRLGHAYLIAGPPGVGKKPLALALAEAVNGIDNLTDLQGKASSNKSSWYLHPDIHVYLPLPGDRSREELKARVKLLADDPYEIVDFTVRPSLTDQAEAKNRKAFYSIDYFREQIRPATMLKPNEGRRTVIIISNIEKMRVEGFNAFLKMLEEPAEGLMFILTTDNIDTILPTVISRCHLIPCTALTHDEIKQGLITYEGRDEADSAYLSRIAAGNYSLTRFYDPDTLKSNRDQVIEFLRYAFSQDAKNIIFVSRNWHSDLNQESQIALMNILEVFIRDLMIYEASGNENLVTNTDQLQTIRKFCTSLTNARLDEMITEVLEARKLLNQNVNARLIFTVLANRFSALMRGKELPDRTTKSLSFEAFGPLF
ncbi:MAG: DNA polymerase III subunit delta' C-terminal domain-containing protein [Balneolales bacterium]